MAIGAANLFVTLDSHEKYLLDPLERCSQIPSFPPSLMLFSIFLYFSMFEGQNTLSLQMLRSAGMNVNAANNANAIPRARTIPIVCTSENEHSASAANPMMTDIPDVKTDSPPHMIASFRAASWSRPFLHSSLYLVMMKTA